MQKTDFLEALSEGKAKAVEFDKIVSQLKELKEQLTTSNELLQESIPRSEFLCLQTNIVNRLEEFKEIVSLFSQEAKLLISDSIFIIDEALSDPQNCRPAIFKVVHSILKLDVHHNKYQTV